MAQDINVQNLVIHNNNISYEINKQEQAGKLVRNWSVPEDAFL